MIDGVFDASLALELNRALVTYTLTPGASGTIVTQIKTTLKAGVDNAIVGNQANDPYRAFMYTGHYTWGSNQTKANWANLLTYARVLGIGTAAEQDVYRQVAEEYLHYFHGRNPLALTYLTNAGQRGANLGADKSPMQAYHSWWPDGSTSYDGAGSTFGPVPGYVIGGPNQFFDRNWISPPFGMPPMKAYRDWNTVWNEARQDTENSWEFNEPAIYTQAAYVLLVSQYATTPNTTPTGNGLRGTYFSNKGFTGNSVTRIDPVVNFNWGTGGPSPVIGPDTFSARWTGQIRAIEDGTYTFRTRSTDGVRVWVNGQRIINNWTIHDPAYNTGTIALAAGQLYTIQIEFFEQTGSAVLQLHWKRPGQTAFELIPQSQLYSV